MRKNELDTSLKRERLIVKLKKIEDMENTKDHFERETQKLMVEHYSPESWKAKTTFHSKKNSVAFSAVMMESSTRD